MKTLLTALLIMIGSMASAKLFVLEQAEEIFLKGNILKISDSSAGGFEALVVYKKGIYICNVFEATYDIIQVSCANTVIK